MLLQLKDQAEVVIAISAEDIASNKIRGDYGITYDQEVLRLIDAFTEYGLLLEAYALPSISSSLMLIILLRFWMHMESRISSIIR